MSGPDFSAPRGWPDQPPPGPPAPWVPAPPPPMHPVPPPPMRPGPLPAPPGYPPGYPPRYPLVHAAPTGPAEPPRPAALPVTMCLTVTAGLLWPCALASAWIFALLGEETLSASTADLDSRTVLLLNHFSARLIDGLAVPLFGFPLVAVVLAFLLAMRRGWPRIAYTLWGALTVVWLTWWLRDNLVAALAPAVYVAIAVALVWLPSVTAWLSRRSGTGGRTLSAGRVGAR